MIQYKAEEVGIKTIFVEESYTSQTCAVCGNVNKSNRKYRGLYVCSCKNVLNADVNGAINILKRVVPIPLMDRDRGSLDNPVRVVVNYSN